MDWNPFNLRGPEFLAFYAVFSFLTIIAMVLWRRGLELGTRKSGDAAVKRLGEDPYEVAFLRGGRAEVIRVAVVSLLERKLLEVDGDELIAKIADPEKVRRPLDRAILDLFRKKDKASALFVDPIVVREADAVGASLTRRKLLPDAATVRRRIGVFFAGLALLWGVAGIKIIVGLSRNRPVLFLIALAVMALVVLFAVCFPKRTALGSRTLSRIREIFTGLKYRGTVLKVGQTNGEIAFLAAVFGLGFLPGTMSGMLKPVHLVPQHYSSSGWSSCGSSSCGFTSTSCGGGSSCGGGGCGGGCGGCGG